MFSWENRAVLKDNIFVPQIPKTFDSWQIRTAILRNT